MPKEIRFDLLSQNAQVLLELPKSFIQDNLLEKCNLNDDERYNTFQYNLNLYLIENLFDLLVYFISETKNDDLFQIISQIIMPLMIYTDFDFNYSKDLTTKILSYIIILYGPRRSDNYYLTEKEVIRPAGRYSPLLRDDTVPKIILSLKYFIEAKIFIPSLEYINENLPKKKIIEIKLLIIQIN